MTTASGSNESNLLRIPAEIRHTIIGHVESDCKPTLPASAATAVFARYSRLDYELTTLHMQRACKTLNSDVLAASKFLNQHHPGNDPKSIARADDVHLDTDEAGSNDVTDAIKAGSVRTLVFPIGYGTTARQIEDTMGNLRHLRGNSYGIREIIFDHLLDRDQEEVAEDFEVDLNALTSEVSDVLLSQPQITFSIRCPHNAGISGIRNFPRKSTWSFSDYDFVPYAFPYYMPDISSMAAALSPEEAIKGITLSLSYNVGGKSTRTRDLHEIFTPFTNFCKKAYEELSKIQGDATINAHFFVLSPTVDDPAQNSFSELEHPEQLTEISGQLLSIAEESRPADCKGQLNLSFGKAPDWPYGVRLSTGGGGGADED